MYILDTRSLIEIRGSLLVTLPISWVRHNALTEGRKVSVALDDSGQLVITPITTEKRNGIPAAGVDIGPTTPGAGGHRTKELVQVSISTDNTKRFARIQRTPEGRLLGCAVMIPAEIVEQYVDNSTETLNFDLIAAPEGIFIEIE